MDSDKEMEKLAGEYLEEGLQKLNDNKLDQAALLVQNALHLFKRVGNIRMYARSLNAMGVVYAAIGNETMSVDYYLEGLEYAINYHLNDIITVFYNNIGSRYRELNEHKKAIEYFLKSEKELSNPECKEQERYISWCLITYLNLAGSYMALEKYILAEECLNRARTYLSEEINEMYRLSFMVTELHLYWEIGRTDYVREHIGELVDTAIQKASSSDYVEDMTEVCTLLKKMEEYEKWKQVILCFEAFAKEQGSVYYQLILTEMWMEYYKCAGDMQRYIHLCVDHAELYQKQKNITDKERAAAIDIKIELQEKEAARRKAELKSSTDSLTGLGNRYMLEIDMNKIFEDAKKGGSNIAVGVLDVDCFKQQNDTYGHMRGDDCLCKVANILEKVINEHGKAYRFGGDEFVLLVYNGEEEIVEHIAEKIKKELHQLQLENINSVVLPEVTISQGYVCMQPQEEENGTNLLQYADKALYQVKKNGRNGYYIYRKEAE